MQQLRVVEVFGTRQGHNRGRGRIVPGASSSSQSTGQSHPIVRVYTQDEVDAMFASQEAQIQAMQAQLNFLTGQILNSPPPSTQWNFPSSSNFQNVTNLKSDGDDDDDDQ